MKALKFNFAALHNEEHFQFQNEFKALVEQHGASKLGVNSQFNDYQLLYSNEMSAINTIHKSATSDQLTAADDERDEVYKGLAGIVKAYLNHRNGAKRDAATRLSILFSTYGNVARKPYNEETAAIIKLLSELKGSYSDNCVTLNLGEWIADLESTNNAFDVLMKNRFSEGATKLDVEMRATRIKVDTSVRGIIEMVDALILVNGITAYEPFIKEYNARVEKYNNNLAIRKGRYSAKTPPPAAN